MTPRLDRSTDAKSMPTDCRGTLRRTERSRNNRIATVRGERCFGYVMLGLVAEKAGTSAFHDLVRDQVAAPLGIDRVFRARTRRDQRLPGEGFHDQPGTRLTPEFPDREVGEPLPYGGEGWLTESMTAGGGLAASAGAVAPMIGHYAVWGLDLRRANQNWARSGAMAGTSSLAISRPDGLDLCFILNTRNFGGANAMGEASNDIKRVLDSMPAAESSTTQ
jgi:CubicO group peptidase (beta-lactamase class C family)